MLNIITHNDVYYSHTTNMPNSVTVLSPLSHCQSIELYHQPSCHSLNLIMQLPVMKTIYIRTYISIVKLVFLKVCMDSVQVSRGRQNIKTHPLWNTLQKPFRTFGKLNAKCMLTKGVCEQANKQTTKSMNHGTIQLPLSIA